MANKMIGCFDAETEVFTDSGWKYFPNLSKNDLVMQYEKGGCSFVAPTDYSEVSYSDKMHYFTDDNYYDFMVTPEYAKELTNTVLLSGKKSGGSIEKLSLLDRFKIAYSSSDIELIDYVDDNTIAISVSTERPFLKFIRILDGLGWKHLSHIDGSNSLLFHVTIPEEVTFSKSLGWVNFVDKGQKWCAAFLKEVIEWGGHGSINKCSHLEYATKLRDNGDVVQMATFLCGYTNCLDVIASRGDSIPIVRLLIDKLDRVQIGKRRAVDYKGKAYSISVPSGMLVLRRNDRISILKDCVC